MNPEAIIVVFIAAIVGPAFLSWLNNRQAVEREERAVKRQEAAAAKVAEAAATLLKSNTITEFKLNTLQVSADQIHLLVNSNMTARMQAELDATVRELVALREIAELKRAAGMVSAPEAERAIAYTVIKIAEMRAALRDRLDAQARIDASIKAEDKP